LSDVRPEKTKLSSEVLLLVLLREGTSESSAPSSGIISWPGDDPLNPGNQISGAPRHRRDAVSRRSNDVCCGRGESVADISFCEFEPDSPGKSDTMYREFERTALDAIIDDLPALAIYLPSSPFLRNLAPSSSFWANPPRAQQGPDGRPALSRATTWRTSAPRLAHEDSKEDLDV